MTKSVTDALTAEQQRLLVKRILASVLFRKSHKLASFLKFICEQQQLGKADTINEQRIGTEVFGRTEGYHMGEDSIVRSQARFLRQRLDEYFASEGRDEAIRLTVPKGSYVPEFHYREVSPQPELAKLDGATVGVAEPPAPRFNEPSLCLPSLPPPSSRRLLVPVLAAVCLASLFAWHFRPAAAGKPKTTVDSRFWLSLFDPQRTEIIVPADSSLILMEELSGKPVNPSDYMTRKYLEAPAPPEMASSWDAVKNSQYTNMADLNLVAKLERLPEVGGARVRIRFSRDINLKELKESNAILIGGSRSNPWVQLFDTFGHFQGGYDWQTHVNYIHNRLPGPGEQERYNEIGDGAQHLAYGVIAYLPSLDGQGSALLVGGTSKAGTEAAAEFLFTPNFTAILRSVDSGTEIPRFEVLLSTQNLNGDSYQGKIVCFHLLPETAPAR